MRAVTIATAAVMAASLALAGAFSPAQAAQKPSEPAASSSVVYATVPDGVPIAMHLVFPAGFTTAHGKRWPALFNMDGYGGAGTHNDDEFDSAPTKSFVLVYASVRGTGCSGGTFDLFGQQSALDGKWIIDHWIPAQPWSNGRVGIFGHSYSGITGLAVAETDPSHLDAVAVSGLIGDLYRNILYMGGVPNPGFPLLWGQVLRPEEELTGNISNLAQSSRCRDDFLEHGGSDLVVPPKTLLGIYAEPYASPTSWAERHSLMNGVARVDAPTWMAQQYQDEQTGPDGGVVLWQAIRPGVPKRLLLTNGLHTTNHLFNADRLAWLKCWVIDAGSACPGGITDPSRRVVIFFGTTGPGNTWQDDHLGVAYTAANYPSRRVSWTREYLCADHTISASPTAEDCSGDVPYLSATAGRQTTGDLGFGIGNGTVGDVTFLPGPDEANFVLPFNRPEALAGPIQVNLWMTSTATNTDVFADLLDVNLETGATTYLQRGLLRASLRSVELARSKTIASGPARGQVYWWWHPYLHPDGLQPGRPFHMRFEIYPIGHVFYPGHALVLSVHAPSPSDPLSTYIWASGQPPALNTIIDTPGHRSSILVPFLASLPASTPRTAPACGSLTGEPCFTPIVSVAGSSGR